MTKSFRLGDWLVDLPGNRMTSRDGRTESLEPKVMKVLAYLASRPLEVVTREELDEEIWPGEHVTEHSLSRCISALRKALGDDPSTPRYIETIRKGGYRLLCEPEHVDPGRARVPTRDGARRWPLVAALAALLGVATIVIAILRDDPPASTMSEVSIVPVTTFRGTEVDPAIAPHGAAVAFSWTGEEGSNYDIYVKAFDVENPRRLTTDPGEDKNPCWSDDGKSIAFVRSTDEGGGIWLVPATGGTERKIIDLVSGDIPDLVWRGRHLYFSDRDAPDEPAAIFRLNVDTLARTRITNPEPGVTGDRDLDVSADETRIAFARARLPGVEDLFISNADGSDPRRLTTDNASINGLSWSTDGTSILFSSSREGFSEMWRVDLDGSSPRRVFEFGHHAYDPHVASDGRRVAFERKSFDSNVLAIRVAEPDKMSIVAGSTRWDSDPAISPDNVHVAFVSDRSGTADLWRSRLDGSDVVRIVHARDAPVTRGISWSPDGSLVSFTRRHEEESSIWIVSVDGDAPMRLTAPGLNAVHPAFSPDGRTIYFASNQTGEWGIWKTPVAGGDVQRVEGALGMRVIPSHDGAALYLSRLDRTGVSRFDLATGSETGIPISGALPDRLDWTVSGSSLYFRAASGNVARPASIYRVPVAGGTAEPVFDPLDGLSIPHAGISVATDDSILVFGVIELQGGDIVMLESPNARF